MANKFQTSVADVVIRDVDTGIAIAHGKTNISTALSMTMQVTEMRGGINNPLLYTYFHDRDLEVSIEMATFNEWVLALQTGQTISSGNVSVVETECVVLASGSATLDYTPTGDVTFIFDDNDAAVPVTPTGSDIIVPAGLNRKGVAIYDRLTTADRITVETTEQPSTVQLVLTARVYKADQSGVVQYFQVNVPRFKLDGNYELSMGADGISTQPLTGRALKVESSDCSNGDYYYTATYINVDSSTAPYILIAAAPSPMTLAGSGIDSQISVLGYRGGVYSNELITNDCTYAITAGCATITVGSATGLVSSSPTALPGDNATIAISYWDVNSGSLTDSLYALVS